MVLAARRKAQKAKKDLALSRHLLAELSTWPELGRGFFKSYHNNSDLVHADYFQGANGLSRCESNVSWHTSFPNTDSGLAFQAAGFEIQLIDLHIDDGVRLSIAVQD